jgi:hypothetical protein
MYCKRDRSILRELGRQVAQAAADPVMEERRRLWRSFHSLHPERPMILVFPEGSWREILPPESLECSTAVSRQFESDLRRRLFYRENLYDDTVIEARVVVHVHVERPTNSDWGLPPRRRDAPTTTGAYAFDPVLQNAGDLERLQAPQVRHDEAGTQAELETAHEIFDGVLPVEKKGVDRADFHMTKLYIERRGLTQTMLDMYDNPEIIHGAMRIFTRGYHAFFAELERQALLDLNNDETYNHTGGVGYTDELPAAGFEAGTPIRRKDMWAMSEAQELAQVSPALHEEFSLTYERELLAPFGLAGYGCCEPLERKLNMLKKIPNLRMVSVAPSADVESCAEQLGDGYVFSWKPDPSQLVGRFEEDHIRSYIERTLRATRGCVLQMVLKDTHTCGNDPHRFTRWTQIARELVESAVPT